MQEKLHYNEQSCFGWCRLIPCCRNTFFIHSWNSASSEGESYQKEKDYVANFEMGWRKTYVFESTKGGVWVVIWPRNRSWYNLLMRRVSAKEWAKVAARCTAVSEQGSDAQHAGVAGAQAEQRHAEPSTQLHWLIACHIIDHRLGQQMKTPPCLLIKPSSVRHQVSQGPPLGNVHMTSEQNYSIKQVTNIAFLGLTGILSSYLIQTIQCIFTENYWERNLQWKIWLSSQNACFVCAWVEGDRLSLLSKMLVGILPPGRWDRPEGHGDSFRAEGKWGAGPKSLKPTGTTESVHKVLWHLFQPNAPKISLIFLIFILETKLTATTNFILTIPFLKSATTAEEAWACSVGCSHSHPARKRESCYSCPGSILHQCQLQ